MTDNAMHTEFLRCRDHLFAALVAEMGKRNNCPGLEWIDNEREAIVDSAHAWALPRFLHYVTVDEVEAVESLACGHVDYAQKFALYVAELIYEVR